MVIPIAIHSKSVFKPEGWSVGKCLRCDRFEAVLLGQWSKITSVNLIAVSKQFVSTAGICHWCEQPVHTFSDVNPVQLQEWSPRDGIAALFSKCAPQLMESVPRIKNEGEINTILDFVTRRTRFGKVGVGGIGTICGFLLGAILSGLIVYLFAEKVADIVVFGLVVILIGTIGGLIVGACAEAFFRMRSFARYFAES